MSVSAAASSALADPLRAMLLWVLMLSEQLEPPLLRLLGLKDVDVASVEAAYADTLLELRSLRVLGKYSAQAEVGHLIMARLTCLLVCEPDPQQLLQATRCAARLPLWVRDPELDALEREARRETATARILEAHANVDEARERRAAAKARSAGCQPDSGAPEARSAARRAASPSARDSSPVSLATPASVNMPHSEEEEMSQARPGAPQVRQTPSGAPGEAHADAPQEAPDAAKSAILVTKSEDKVKSQPAKPRSNARRKAAMRR